MADKNIQINIKSENKATPNIDKVSSSLKRLNNGVDAISSGMANFNDSLRSYNNAMSGVNSMFRSTLREASEMVIGFTSDAIKSYSQLEQQHAKTLGAMANDYGKTASEQQKLIDNGEKLKKQAIELSRYGQNGRGSLVNPTEISSAQTALIKSGKSADQILRKDKSGATPVDTIVRFAKGNDLDMETAVDFAVTLGEQFNYSMDKWGEMLDKVSHAADTSIIEVVDIVNSMKYAGGIASGLNRPMEEVLSMLSLMGNAGLKGSIAGTGVQAFFTRLLASGTTVTESALDRAPGDAAQSYLDFYTSVVTSDGNLSDMDTVLAELDSAMQELDDEEQTWFARKVFSLFQMKAAYALTGTQDADIFQKTMDEIENNSGGTNTNKYNYQLNSQAGRLEALKVAWEATKTDIGDRMSPLVTAISNEVLTYLQNNGKYNINIDTIEKAIDTSRVDIASAYGNDIADFISSIATGVVDAGMIGEALLPQVGGIGGAFIKIMNGDISGAFDELSTSLSETNENIEDLPTDLQDMAEAVRNVIVALTALAAINTASNVITSASTIWGVTGGALLGAGAKGLAGATAGASSYGLYKTASNVASKTSRSGNKLYSGMNADGLFDPTNKYGADSSKNLDDLSNEIYRIMGKIDKNGGWTRDTIANSRGEMSSTMSRAKELYGEIDSILGSVSPEDAKVIQNKVNSKVQSYNNVTRIMRMEKDLAKLTSSDSINNDDRVNIMADTLYNAKNNMTAYERAVYDERISAERLANARKPVTKQNDYKFQTNTDEVVDYANGDMQWYKKKHDKVVQKNVVPYVSPEEKIDQLLNEHKLDETAEGLSKSMDDLDNVTKDVLKRKIDESKAISKSIAKENEKVKIAEDVAKSQKAIKKSYEQVTTDLIDVAKKSKEVADTVGAKMPYTGAPVPKTTKSVVGMSKAVDTIIDSTTGGDVISDDLLKSAQRVSSDLNKIKNIEGVPESAFKSIDDSIKSLDDVIKKMDSIAKKSAQTNSGKVVDESINSIDDMIDSARTLLKANSKDTLEAFTKKYGISMRTMLDYLNDAKASGKSGDDVLRSLEDGADIMAKHIADVYGTTDELSKAIWASISKGNKLKMIAGGFGKAALNIGGELSFGILQDIIFENTHKLMNNGLSSLDVMDLGSSSLWDWTSLFTGIDKSYLGISNSGLKSGFNSGIANTQGQDIPRDTALVNAIVQGLGTSQAQIWTGTGYKNGSMYYKRGADGSLQETGLASTYGWIDGLMRSLYTEAKGKGINIPLDEITSSTQSMINELNKNMSANGLTDKDASGIMFPGKLSEVYKSIRSKYNLSAPDPLAGYNTDTPQTTKVDSHMSYSEIIANEMKKYFRENGNYFNQFRGGSSFLERVNGINSMVSNPSLKLDFKPNLNVSVQVSNTGRVLGQTVTLPDYNGLASWSAVQQSRVGAGNYRND